jgi:hypothetical protein
MRKKYYHLPPLSLSKFMEALARVCHLEDSVISNKKAALDSQSGFEMNLIEESYSSSSEGLHSSDSLFEVARLKACSRPTRSLEGRNVSKD